MIFEYFWFGITKSSWNLYYTRLDKNMLFPYENCMEIVCIDASLKESTKGGLAPLLWRAAVGRPPLKKHRCTLFPCNFHMEIACFCPSECSREIVDLFCVSISGRIPAMRPLVGYLGA